MHARQALSETMQYPSAIIIYSHLTHKKYNVALKPRHIHSLTTKKLKSNLERVSGVNADDMVLCYGGRVIEDHERVGDWIDNEQRVLIMVGKDQVQELTQQHQDNEQQQEYATMVPQHSAHQRNEMIVEEEEPAYEGDELSQQEYQPDVEYDDHLNDEEEHYRRMHSTTNDSPMTSSRKLLSRQDLAQTSPSRTTGTHQESTAPPTIMTFNTTRSAPVQQSQMSAPATKSPRTKSPRSTTEISPQKRDSQPQPEAHPLNSTAPQSLRDDDHFFAAEDNVNNQSDMSSSSRVSIQSQQSQQPQHPKSRLSRGPGTSRLDASSTFKQLQPPHASFNATTGRMDTNAQNSTSVNLSATPTAGLSASEKQRLIQQFEQRFHQQLSAEKNNLLRLFTDAKKQILKQANSDREKLVRENSRLREELERAYSNGGTVPANGFQSYNADSKINGTGADSLAQRIGELERERQEYAAMRQQLEQRSTNQSDMIKALQNKLVELQSENDKLQKRVEFEEQVSQQHQRLKQESAQGVQKERKWQQERDNIVREFEQEIERLSSLRANDQQVYQSEKEDLMHQMEEQRQGFQQESAEITQQLRQEIGEYVHQLEEMQADNTRLQRLWEKAQVDLQNNALFVQSAEDTIEQLKQHIEKLSRGDTTSAQLLVNATREAEMMRKRAQNYEKDSLLVRERLLQETRKRKHLHNALEDLKGNIRVIVRLRPLLSNEHYPSNMSGRVEVRDDTTVTVTSAATGVKVFDFYQALGFNSVQNDVFEEVRPVIQSAIDGVNVCIIAYGATGSGKTFTIHGNEIMEALPNASNGGGSHQKLSASRGVLPRAAEELFKHLHDNNIWNTPPMQGGTFTEGTSSDTFSITCSMIELYLDEIHDLLLPPSTKRKRLELREHPTGGMFVQGVSEHPVSSAEELLSLIHQGNEQKQIHKTSVHDRSSRSHTIFTINLVLHFNTGRTSIVSKSRLLFVDLAGSERISRSRATGDRFKEAQHINKSLSALGDVICALSKKKAHVPYRNSKLTSILQPCLGGNSKTIMFANISPSADSHSETTSTLGFASRVKKIQNTTTKNREIKTTHLPALNSPSFSHFHHTVSLYTTSQQSPAFIESFHHFLEAQNISGDVLDSMTKLDKGKLLLEAFGKLRNFERIRGPDREYLSDMMQVEPKYLEHLWRRSLQTQRHGGLTLTHEQKDAVRQWLREHDHRAPTLTECKELALTLGVSILALRQSLHFLAQQPGTVSKEAKQELQQWIKLHQRRPNKTELKQLEQSTGLARFQIMNIIQYLCRANPGRITDESKQIIRKWLEDHNGRAPRGEEREALEKRTGLNAFQVRRCVQVLRGTLHPPTEFAKSIIREWNENHNYRVPTRQERQEFLSLTGLTPYQLSMLLSIRPLLTVPDDLKQRIEDWLQHKGATDRLCQSIEMLERVAEQISLDLSEDKSQIMQYLKGRMQKMNRVHVSETSRRHLRKWIEVNNQLPTSSEKSILQQQTGLTRDQLNHQLKVLWDSRESWMPDRRSADPQTSHPKRIPPSTTQAIAEWLQQNDYELPTKEQRLSLLEKYQISAKQLTDVLYRLRRSNS